MTDDAELLRQYAEERSEEAFSELVRRHIGLVYHAALRQCRDPHRAEDVAQAVFTDLARKAGPLARRPALAGWLHTSARFASLRVIRAEARRRVREVKAHAMNELDPAGEAAAPDRLRPVIDEALQSLGERDREAVVLRFLEGRPFAEVGAALAVTEDAARMRVERALERMGDALRRRGVTSTAAALAAELTAQAGAAAPAGLAAKVAGAALGAGSPAALIAFMSMTKLQTCAAVAVLGLCAAGLVWQHHANVRLRAEVAELRLAAANPPPRAGSRAPAADAAPRNGAPAATGAPGADRPGPPGGRARSGVPLAAGLVPVETLGNAGRATPRAAFATQLWAARTGDIALEASSLMFGPEARARLEALGQTLPPDMRSEYDTPEKLMAFMLAGSPHPVGGMQVLGETDQGPNDVTLQTEWQHVDDDVVHQSEAQMHQDSDGWKLVVPPGLVNRASNYLTRTLEAQAPPGTGK